MPSYVLSLEGVVALERFVTPDTLFAFDLDGTLAPIVEDYSAAQIAEPVRATLERLIKRAKVAVITGRSRQVARAILGFEPDLLVGNHGAEWPLQAGQRDGRQATVCRTWREHLGSLLSCTQGVEIEFKEESVSLHYRKADDSEKTLAQINAALDKLEPGPRRIGGKFVVNLLPMDAFTKGEALLAAMEMFGLQRAIFIGDDVTDEEVFKLGNADVFGIHIGSGGQTAAPYYLNDQTELIGLLNSMVGMLEVHREEI